MDAVCITEHCTRELRDHETSALMLICTPCLHQMRAALTAIPAALIVLRHGSMQRERTGETGRTGTREAPLPGRLDTLNLVGPAAHADVHDQHGDQTGQRPIIGTLGDWTRVICEERRLNGPQQWTETALAGWLVTQLGWASQQQWAGEMHGELRDLTWAIRGIARVEVRTRAISRPCPRCQMMTLSRTDHDVYTRCSNCGTAWTDAELNADAVERSAA
jgi:ribosomal protein L37AE/L43A